MNVKVLGLASCGEDLWGFTWWFYFCLLAFWWHVLMISTQNKFDMKTGFESWFNLLADYWAFPWLFCLVCGCWRGFGVMTCLLLDEMILNLVIWFHHLHLGSVSGGYDSKGCESKATFRCKMHFKAFVFILVFVVSWGIFMKFLEWLCMWNGMMTMF